MAFKENRTLETCLRRAMWKQRVGLMHTIIFMVRFNRASQDVRQEVEKELTRLAVLAGAIPPTGPQIVDGIYVGSWLDLFEWFLENLPAILEAIMQILDLFTQGA